MASAIKLHRDLGFKVPESFHRRFKMAALLNGKSMTELLIEIFERWLKDKNLRL